MKWIGSRISFVDHPTKTTVVIEPEKNFWVNMMMGAWLAMWYVVGFTLIWAFYTLTLSKQEQIIVIVSLVFWLYYASRVTKAFLWLQYGKEKTFKGRTQEVDDHDIEVALDTVPFNFREPRTALQITYNL